MHFTFDIALLLQIIHAQPTVLLSAQTPGQSATPCTTKKDICPAVTTFNTAHFMHTYHLNGCIVQRRSNADTKQLYTQDTAPLQLIWIFQSVLCCLECWTMFFCWPRFALVAAGQAVSSCCFKWATQVQVCCRSLYMHHTSIVLAFWPLCNMLYCFEPSGHSNLLVSQAGLLHPRLTWTWTSIYPHALSVQYSTHVFLTTYLWWRFNIIRWPSGENNVTANGVSDEKLWDCWWNGVDTLCAQVGHLTPFKVTYMVPYSEAELAVHF